ncbi:outer membrane beta-barrel protein [Sphingobacterium sp. BS-2]|uniref:outer membrane beta-barrel protein n=1 Tax=Sphingobacterium sp. BS-2 TaxID=3377129 RepID=UPI0038FD2472
MLLQIKLCTLLLLFSVTLHAQSIVNGRVHDENNAPLSQVTVSIKSISNQTQKSISTDKNGSFSFDLPYGNYDLIISYLGYSNFIRKDIPVASMQMNLGNITLLPSAQSLEEIEIKGERKLIERLSDRMVINIENSILADGMTALEILQRAPAVKVDDDGNISMRGKTDVAVMINGKLSYLSPRDLATLLKGTSSSSIKSVELITNPSAKYDAQGMGGMINIVMKNDKKAGFNLSVNSYGGAGRKERYGAGFNLNSQKDNWNFILGFDKGFRGEEEFRTLNRFFERNPSESLARESIQYSHTNEPLQTNNAKAGVDFQANEKLSLGIGWTGSFGTYKNFNEGYNNILFSNEELISNSLTNNSNISKWNTHTLMANLQQKIGSNDNLLSADFEYLHAHYKADQQLISDFQKTNHRPAFLSKRKNQTPSITQLYVGKLDYLQHINSHQRLELGWKSSFMNADNNAINDTLKVGNWVNDGSTSNHFLYNENIHAGYVNYHLESNNWNFTAGIRVENTYSLGNQLTSNLQNERKYTNWFPSTSITRKIGEKHSVQFSYSKRVNRPDYEDLNPFRYYIDAFVFYEGNPLLQPELANAFELNYSFGKNLHASFYYTDVKDVMTSVLTQLPAQNVTIRTIANIEGFRNKGVNINHSYSPINFWTSINNANIFENHYFGKFNNESIDNREWSYAIQPNNIFKLPKKWSFEINGQYNSPQTDGVLRQKGFGFVSAGLMKNVWKDKVSLKLAVNDIFKSMTYQTESYAGGVRMNQNFNLDSRTFIFSATIKLGKELNGRQKKKDNEEQNRVRGGN